MAKVGLPEVELVAVVAVVGAAAWLLYELGSWVAGLPGSINDAVSRATESSLHGDARAIADEVGGDPFGLNPREIV